MWLEGRLGTNREKVKRVVMTFPPILSMGLDTMDWKIVWLQQRLSLTQEQLITVIVKYPNLLAYSIEENIEPTLKWLEEDLGLDASVAGALVVRQPRLLSANLEHNLKNKVGFFLVLRAVSPEMSCLMKGVRPLLQTNQAREPDLEAWCGRFRLYGMTPSSDNVMNIHVSQHGHFTSV